MDNELDISGVYSLVVLALNDLTPIISKMSNEDQRKENLIMQRAYLRSVAGALNEMLSS